MGPIDRPDPRGQAKHQEPQTTIICIHHLYPSPANLPLGFYHGQARGLGCGGSEAKDNDNQGNERWRRSPLETRGETLGVNRGWLTEAGGCTAPLVAASHHHIPWLLAAGFCP